MTKTLRVKFGVLKKILKESNTLSFDEMISEATNITSGNDSIDTQVDKFFIDHERASKEVTKTEARRQRKFARTLLEEKDESEETPVGQGTLDDINVQEFASHVARLVDNFESLIETRRTIARRAVKYLTEAYDKETVEVFKATLSRDFDIELDMSKEDADLEKFPTTYSAEAGPYAGKTS